MNPVLTTPELSLDVEGVHLPDELMAALAQVTVRSELGLPTQCELVFRDPGHELFSGLVLSPGRQVRLHVGGLRRLLFTGDVTCVEHEAGPGASRSLFVRAYDRLHRLRKHQRLDAHADVTVEDLARRLVREHELTVESWARGPIWRSLIHDGRDDLTFLADVAARAGLYPHIEDDTLRLVSLQGRGLPIPLVLGDSLRSLRSEVNADRAVDQVETLGWNPRSAEIPRGRSDRPELGRRTEASLTAKSAHGQAGRWLVEAPAESDEHADTLATAELTHRAASTVVLSGVAEGDARLIPGARVAVQGLAPHLDGLHVLTAVEHHLDPRTGFTSRISTRAPTRPNVAAAVVTAEGEVTQVADPDGLGRVRVQLFGYNNVETDWLRVLSPGGGAGKGFVTVPSIQDRVLVLLAGGDPARGVVLGGLFGSEGPPDTGVSGDKVQRFSIRTPTGHHLTFDEDKGEIAIENGDGTRLLLSPDKVILHSKRDLVLEAPGRNMALRAKRIDFEQA